MTAPPDPDVRELIDNPDLLSAIGRVITRWAILEGVVEDMIAGFLGADVKWVYTVTASMNASTRLASLVALARLRLSDDHFKKLSQLTATANQLGPFRNKVVHGIWAKTDDPDLAIVSAVKSGWKLKFQTEYMNVVYLEWLEREIMDCMSALFGFAKEFGVVR